MKTMLPTEVRNRWKSVLRRVADGEEEILIHLKGDRGVVMMTAELYASLLATLEVLDDPDAMKTIRKHRRRKGRTWSLADIDRLIDGGP